MSIVIVDTFKFIHIHDQQHPGIFILLQTLHHLIFKSSLGQAAGQIIRIPLLFNITPLHHLPQFRTDNSKMNDRSKKQTT